MRIFAGLVVLELVRIAAATLKPPSMAQAIRLVSFNQYREIRTSSVENLEREVRRGFAQCRNTAHLHAAAIYNDPNVSEIENCGMNTLRFLARARGLEDFIDKNIAGGSFKWTPWRVPASVDPITKIQFMTLSDVERSAAGLN